MTSSFAVKSPMNGAMKTIVLSCFLLVGSLFTPNHTCAQRTSWGIMWNGGLVHIPAVYRFDTFIAMPPGNLGIKSESRPAVTAPLAGWGIHTYTRMYEFNPESSIGLVVNPMGAIYIPYAAGNGWDFFDVLDSYGFPLMAQVPVMLHFANGMFSTSSSTKDIGWGISAGIESSFLLDLNWVDRRNSERYEIPSAYWVRPAVAAHLRYWNRNDKPRELSFQFSTHRDAYTDVPVSRPMFRISYGGYWNY